MIAFITKRIPISYNNKSSNSRSYKAAIISDFLSYKFEQVPFGNLYIKVFYLTHTKYQIDADNLSKPVVDSLRGQVYLDDKTVAYRMAAKIYLDGEGLNEFNITNMPSNILVEMLNIWDKEDHFLYIEVGNFDRKMLSFGEKI